MRRVGGPMESESGSSRVVNRWGVTHHRPPHRPRGRATKQEQAMKPDGLSGHAERDKLRTPNLRVGALSTFGMGEVIWSVSTDTLIYDPDRRPIYPPTA